MENNKGFSLVELLAAVVIMGILMGVGIPAVTKHLQKSKEESYDVMITSIHDGATAYMMNRNIYPTGAVEGVGNININIATDLEGAGFVESLSDPGSTGKCGGTVYVGVVPSVTGSLPEYSYILELDCPSYDKKICWNYTHSSCDIEK